MGRQKNSRATFYHSGIDISLQPLINTHSKEMLILPASCSFRWYGICAGSLSFQETLNSRIWISSHGTILNIEIFSWSFLRIKRGLEDTMWMVQFMLMLRWSACKTWSIQMTSEPGLFTLLFGISQWQLYQVKYSILFHSFWGLNDLISIYLCLYLKQ